MRRLVLGCALLLAVAGCESARPATPPGSMAFDPEQLTGTWTGSWADTPLTLVVVDHTTSAPYSGLYVGPWLVAGGTYPGINGILTYTRSGVPASVGFKGWVSSIRPVHVHVLAEPPDGQIRLDLRAGGPAALVGEGHATFYWAPRGPVALARR